MATSFLAGLLVFPAKTFPTPASATTVSYAEDLTGTWLSNDGGTYYVRQLDNAVWWVGLDATDGGNFSNVFHGTRDGDVITGSWADVPRGRAMSQGLLTLAVVSTERGTELVARQQTGGFGGTGWSRGTAPQRTVAEGTRTILDDGTVEIRDPDGTVRQYHPDGSRTTIFPDGTRQRMLLNQTPVATPPLSLLSSPNLKPWLERHRDELLSVIQGLLTPAEADQSIARLRNAERGKSLYDQIDFRTGAITKLRR
jgi:hypothetical protein